MVGAGLLDLLLDVGDELLGALGLPQRLPGDPGLLLPGGAEGGVLRRLDDGGAIWLKVSATDGGGVRVLVTVADATASHEYRYPLQLPAGASPVFEKSGAVQLLGPHGENLGSIAPAWAKDANGAPLATSYSLEGHTLVQTVAFDETTTFPIVLDPWYNPFSWDWSGVGQASVTGLKNCGVGALAGVVGTGAATVTTNVALNAAGRTLIKVAGGPWGYVGLGVGGCVAKLIGG
ncbi:hypothetical protein [Modestobacter sp. SYSU DS0875]